VELGNCFVGRPGKKQLGGLRGLASPGLGLWSYFGSKAEERPALASHSRNPKVMAPQLTDRDATLSARRVCCPCSGHMSTSVFVIDRGSRTQPKPDARQCRCGSDTLSLYATVGLLRSCREDAHTNAGLPEISEKPPIPSRARIVTSLAVKRQVDLTASITKFSVASFLYAARSNFSGASETKSAPILVLGIYSSLTPSSPRRFL
jgi:hypothetical protein